MGIGGGRLALRQSIATGSGQGTDTSDEALYPPTVPGLTGWWDAASLPHLRGPEGQAGVTWSGQCAEVLDRSGGGDSLRPFRYIADARVASPYPRLSGLLGGVGQINSDPGLAKPALDPDLGLRLSRNPLCSQDDWTLCFVWSRPNWRQGSFRDSDPVALIRAGSTIVLAVDSVAPHRLTLFPSGPSTVLMAPVHRRHTHSLVIRYSRGHGIDAWLDDAKVASGVVNPLPALPTGSLLFLHDGAFMGGAQCWFHEAACWGRSVTDLEIAHILAHLGRWRRGRRAGVTLLINGQSNAVNYSLNDGAAELLARGVAWHLGAAAWNVVATTGNPSSYTMQSGHGLYQVQHGAYPGSFLTDPMNGSSPVTWALGVDGQAVQTAIRNLSAEDRDDIRAIVWPWNETDSLRTSSELPTFVAAVNRFLQLEREMAGKTATALPLICWSAIPYGTAEGTAMHRRAIHSLIHTTELNIVVGNPQTSDSNQRGATWSEATGVAVGGDPAHRDGDDNRRFARLAAPVVARAVLAGGGHDSISEIPASVPMVGGPRLVHVYRQTNTTLIATVVHDAGSDLKVPRQATSGKGFVVTDGGLAVGDGNVVRATSCERLNNTQLRLVLEQPLQHSSVFCALHYPFGGESIGRGNAVTDNCADVVKPEGWDIAADLGASWQLDFPLSATFLPIALSDTPYG